MSALNEGNYLGDWLVEEFGAPNYCRDEVSVLAPADIPSGAVIGLATTLTSYYAAYDNTGGANTGRAAAASAILMNSVAANAKVSATLVDSSNTGTLTFTEAHCLKVGDVIAITECTDTDANIYYEVATVPTALTLTVTTASVTDSTYAVKVQKLNHAVTALVKGPAVVSASGIDWGASDATGITAGTAELLALNIATVEGV